MTTAEARSSNDQKTNQKTVHVAIYDGWADWEPGHLMARVQNPAWQRDPGRFRIQTVGASLEPVATMGGLTVLPDLTVSQVTPSESAMLVLPGSDGFTTGIPWATDLARAFIDASVPVAAICGATFALAAAGLLDDRRHTGADKDYLAMSGYAGNHLYVEADVVSERGVITAGPVDALPFARAALQTLEVFEPAILNAWYRLFTQHDASAFYELAAYESGRITDSAASPAAAGASNR